MKREDAALAVVAAVAGELDGAVEGRARHAWLEAAVAPAFAILESYPAWPVVALPLAIAQAHRVNAVPLAASCLMFFASADAIDDAQDGDLDPGAFDSWQQAVNAGMALSFMAPQVAMAAVAPERRGAVAAAFTRAGAAMSFGQQRDFAQRGKPGGVTEADYTACLRGKAGGSFRLFASLGAIAAGNDLEMVEGLGAFGEALGMAMQLASDIADLASTDGRDHRNQVLTLPVIYAHAHLVPTDRPLLSASWRGEAGATPLAFWLERTGALAYARTRLAVLRTEARLHLDQLSLPPNLKLELESMLAGIDQEGPGAVV